MRQVDILLSAMTKKVIAYAMIWEEQSCSEEIELAHSSGLRRPRMTKIERINQCAHWV
jgi:hypothetical protein